MKELKTNHAPAALGPYSQGVETAAGIVYVSGQLPIDPDTGEFTEGGIKEQTRQSLKNIEAILGEAGMDLSNVVKTTVLLAHIEDFGPMNEEYANFFKGICPARAAFEAAAIPKGALVEIEAVAVRD